MGNYMYPKAIMTIKELVKDCGYPDRIIREIAHMQGAKSVIKRKGGAGSTFYFQTNLLEEDLEEWKRVNGV